jgi:hypothetical protein
MSFVCCRSFQPRVQVRLAPRFFHCETSDVSIEPEIVKFGAVPPPGKLPPPLNSGMENELELSRSSRPP